jgi:hypothetical protein
MQSLNQLQRKTKRGSNSKQEEEGKYHERRDDHGRKLVIQEVLEELIDITHLLTQQEILCI